MAYETRRPLFNLSGVLAADISPTDTTISGASGLFTTLDTDYSAAVVTPLVIANDAAGKAEIVYVVSHAQGASSVTVVRGREGTAAQSFSAGDVIRCSPTPWDTQRIGGHAGQTGSFLANAAGGVTLPLAGQDTYGGVSVANNAIKVPATGLYRITNQFYLSGGTGNLPFFGYCEIWRNGARDTGMPVNRILKFDTQDYSNVISVQKRLTANDTLSLRAISSYGSTYGSNGYDGCFLELDLVARQ